jgi:hypothetical protein
VTESALRQRQEITSPRPHRSPTSRHQPMVLITDRGRQLPSRLNHLDQPREIIRRGSLEQHPSPKPEGSSTRQEINPRRDLISRPRNRSDEEKIEKSTRLQSALAPLRRETRSQSAITKNIPYWTGKRSLLTVVYSSIL